MHTVIYYLFTVGWAQIEDITVDLPSNITVLPQNYTLHAIKIGASDQVYLHDANWYYESGITSTQVCRGYIYYYSCSIGNGEDIDYSNGRYDFTLTVTWNGEIITSGALSQSNNNGDHVYRFYLRVGDVIRNHHHIITGELL